jgi:hypothetical protein
LFVILVEKKKKKKKKKGKRKVTKSFGRFGLHPEAFHLGFYVASVQFHDGFVVGANRRR